MTTIPPRRGATAAGHPARTRPPVEDVEGDTVTTGRTAPAGPPSGAVPSPGAPAGGAVPASSAADRAPLLPTQGVRTGALPPLPPLDLHGTAPLLDAITAEPPAPLPDLAVLRALVRDAARRATALLQGHVPEVHDTVADIVRFTVGAGGEHGETAAAHLGLTPLLMRRLTAAYHHGGPHGAAACLSPRPADPAALAGAETAIRPLRPFPGTPVERRRDRLTDPPAGVQLRHGPDGRWYPYVDRDGTWQPVAGPHRDPVRAYRAARLARRQHH
ncbi:MULTISPECIES: hypothetical protein [unclassified Streptomyces]|uniref:hypothetical protein n=1 Tax=unclassified Streptomyces TaxID=2593676 RepID=UPI0006AE22C1|nr:MULTISPECIES: hypothetical protein [unclassified Streptomyces]